MVLSPRGAVLGRLKVLAMTIWSPGSGKPPPKEPPPDETNRLLEENWAALAAASDADYLARLERFLKGRDLTAFLGEKSDTDPRKKDEASESPRKLYEVEEEEEGLGEAFLDAYEPSAKEKSRGQELPHEKPEPAEEMGKEESIAFLDECLGRLQFRDARAVAKKIVKLGFLSQPEAEARIAAGLLMGERFEEACSELEGHLLRKDEVGFRAVCTYAQALRWRSGRTSAVEFLDTMTAKHRKDWSADRLRDLAVLRTDIAGN